MIIAIDGPAGAGKSTTARGVAERFGFAYVNTGAMYRAVALAAAEQSLSLPQDSDRIIELARELPIVLKDKGQRIFIGEREVTDLIRAPHIGELTSQISAIPEVRASIVRQQRRLAEASRCECGGAVLEGRDIQTVVCPDAEVKIFLTANPQTRAARRLSEWQSKGEEVTFDQAQSDITTRDARDSKREVSPLQAAPDAVVLATDDLSPEEVIERIAQIVREQMR